MPVTRLLLPVLAVYQCNAYAIASIPGSVVVPPDTQAMELTARGAQELALDERNFFTLAWNAITTALPEIKLAMGGLGLVKSTYDAIKDCKKGSHFDCIFGAVDTAFAYFLTQFAFSDLRHGHDRRDLNEYGRAYDQDGSYLVAHIAIANGSTLHQATTGSSNSFDWSHVATSHTAQGQPMQSILYRLASPADLGRPNNGAYHHIRAQPVINGASNSSALRRRNDESNNGGVVVDYLWTNGDNSLWNDLGGKSQANALGSTIADYMENSDSEVSCAVPGIQQSNGNYAGEDQGVLAYGWNNQAFAFKGQSGAWLDGCGAAAGSAAPPPPPAVKCNPDPECTDTALPKCITHNCYCSNGKTVPYYNGKCHQ